MSKKSDPTDDLIVDLRPSIGWRAFSTFRSMTFYISVIALIIWWQGRGMLDTGTGKMAPALRLQSISGEHFAVGGKKDRKTLLIFFAPWCAVCRASSGIINDLYNRGSKSKDFNVYAVATDFQSRNELNAYINQHSLLMPILLGDEATSNLYRIHSLPTYYIINSTGEVAGKASGYTTYIGLLIRLYLAS